jgi:hypothetical protein
MSQFEDWRAICELKARYCRLLDTKDWAGWRALFTDDYVMDVTGETGGDPVVGGDVAVAQVRSFIEAAITCHQVHTPEIAIDGDTATGVWAMQDLVLFTPAGPGIRGLGHYHESYAKADGTWKIARLRLTRLHIEQVAAG